MPYPCIFYTKNTKYTVFPSSFSWKHKENLLTCMYVHGLQVPCEDFTTSLVPLENNAAEPLVVSSNDYDPKSHLSDFIQQRFPVFEAYGEICLIKPEDQFDIDDHALIVFKYLKAYHDGRINSLYFEGTYY